MKTKHKRLARELCRERFFPAGRKHDWAVVHLDKEDILVLCDRRQGDRREREWQGFRNYLYGYDCAILAECIKPDFAVILINASRDMGERLAREFWLLTLAPNSIDDIGNADEIKADPEHLKYVEEHFCKPERYHSIWGDVAVENGQPIGLYVDGELVRQPVTKHWTELADAA
jgi:hypothetical protein